MAWGDIKSPDAFKDLEAEQKDTVKRRERDSQKEALTFVKNAFELVIYVDSAGSAQQKKFTMGSEALFPTLREKRTCASSGRRSTQRRCCRAGRSANGRPSEPSVKVEDMYGCVRAISGHAETGEPAGSDQYDRRCG